MMTKNKTLNIFIFYVILFIFILKAKSYPVVVELFTNICVIS